ncbi:glycosyltransferase family 4 protein [Candidatus Kaiserbacteria bacterium]|nr:glycosyltransferase family 4 protein [Candidatus Kaiserbacteria bacterium]
MKTRILMFGWEFPPFNSGGLGVACQGLTRSLAERGFEVLFVMPKKFELSSPYARMIFAEDQNVTVRAIDSMLSPYLTTKSYLRERESGGFYGSDLFQEVERYRAIASSIAREESFDVIYAHDWLAFGAGIEAKKATGKPLIVHVHATEFDRSGGADGVNSHVYTIERAGMEAADVVIAVSELTKNIIVEKYGIPASKVRVVYNGIDESTAPSGLPSKRMRSLKESGYKIVLFLGRITLQKGPDHFLRAAQRVLQQNPKVMFVVSGSGDMDAQMFDLAAELGISNNVTFTGFLTGADRHDMYVTADLFVMPSVSEPFGITPLESMRLGTPVIISKQSGVAEVVRHALKVDFWDIDDMADKILSVVGMPALSETMSMHAREEADKLTWADAAYKVDTILHELV